MNKSAFNKSESIQDAAPPILVSNPYSEKKALDYRNCRQIPRTWDDVGLGSFLILVGAFFVFGSTIGAYDLYKMRGIVDPSGFIFPPVGILMCWFGIRCFKLKKARFFSPKGVLDVTSEHITFDGRDESNVLSYRKPEPIPRTWDDIGVGTILILIGLVICFESIVAFDGFYENDHVIELRCFIATAIGIFIGWRGVRRLRVRRDRETGADLI